MTIKEWSKLSFIIGQVDGMAKSMEYANDINLESLKNLLVSISTSLTEISESELLKLFPDKQLPKPKKELNK